MENQEIHKLPFWETIARSFKYVLKNRALLTGILPVVGALIVLQMLIGLPMMCSVDEKLCSDDWSQPVTLLMIILASVGVIINYCRSIVCKEEPDFVSLKFWKRLGWYIAASFGLSVIIIIPVFVCVWIMTMFSNPETTMVTTTVLTTLVSVAVSIGIAPLFLVFPAIAVDDVKIIKPAKLFALVKGNHNAVFWAQFIIMMPYWLVSRMMSALYGFIGIEDSYLLNLLFVAIMVALGIIDACFKGAFFAHIYQFFKFYDRK